MSKLCFIYCLILGFFILIHFYVHNYVKSDSSVTCLLYFVFINAIKTSTNWGPQILKMIFIFLAVCCRNVKFRYVIGVVKGFSILKIFGGRLGPWVPNRGPQIWFFKNNFYLLKH
uniref:Uncharacterized protein n=1 Tax=Cacopsylla melanoneura TaxID=428564 RepID=A0A8D9FB51_9HEMI